MNYLAKTLRTDGFKRGLSVVLVGMMISSGLLSQTHHVSADDKANEVVKGILQILIDSQLNKNQRQPPNTPPNQPRPKTTRSWGYQTDSKCPGKTTLKMPQT